MVEIDPKRRYRSFIRDEIEHDFNSFIALYARHYERIFEFGCNTGFNLNLIKKINPNASLFGVDLSKPAIDQGKEKYKLNLEIGDENYLSHITHNSFDLVFTCSVLNHIPDIDKIILQLQRIGRTCLFIECPIVLGVNYYGHDYYSYGMKIIKRYPPYMVYEYKRQYKFI